MNYIGISLSSFVVAFFVSFIVVLKLIPALKKKDYHQPIHDDMKHHESKGNTPTFGGIGIIAGIIAGIIISTISIFLFKLPSFITTKILLNYGMLSIVAVLSALTGIFDDIKKVFKKNNNGISAKQKLALQFFIGVIFSLYHKFIIGGNTSIHIPYFKLHLELGIFYYVIIVFMILAVMNAVNLTDGMDGMLASNTIFYSLFFIFTAVFVTGININNLAPVLTFICIVGAVAAFLIFNRHPAKIFMGDTGSLLLGGLLTVLPFMMGLGVFVPIVGLVFVIEAVSVIIQVASYKFRNGKRVFKMAPIHHHFELSGFSEKKIVVAFTFITFVLSTLCFTLLVLLYN